MSDLRELRALVTDWQNSGNEMLGWCADQIDAILARQGTPPMTREALEKMERQDGTTPQEGKV